MSDHARLGASNSAIWLNCTGAPELWGERERKATIFTAEGSAAHYLSEQLLRGEPFPEKVEIDGFTIDVDDDMKQDVYCYTDECQSLMQGSAWSALEKRVHLDDLWEGAPPPEPLFGTLDFACVKDGVAYLRDLKYGKGVGVEVKGNTQLLYYGLGLLFELPPQFKDTVEWFNLGIVQPRFRHSDGPIRAITVHRDDLVEWGKDLRLTVDNIHNRVIHLRTGPHCRWCVAAGICTALATENQNISRAAFEEADRVNELVGGMDSAALGDLLDKVDLIAHWLKAVQEEAKQRIDKGHTVPGWKLVMKRGIRKWTNETTVAEVLTHEGIDPKDIADLKVKSPAQIQKLLKHNPEVFQTLEDRGLIDATPVGDPYTLVRDEDGREATPPRSSARQLTNEVDPSVLKDIEYMERRKVNG
jgi:hypothetical protein